MSEARLFSRVELFDRLFDASLTETYSLSIRLEQDGLSFSVYANDSKKVIVLQKVEFSAGVDLKNSILADNLYLGNFTSFMDGHPWLRSKFHKVNVFFTGKQFTLVPEAVFTSENAAGYLSLVHEIRTDQVVLDTLCQWADACLVFAADQRLTEQLRFYFPSAQLSHHLSVFIETLLPRFKHSTFPSAMFLNSRKGMTDIMAFKDNRLVFLNAFDCQTAEDSVYFLLFVMEQLQANPEQWPVFISGEVQENDKLSQLLYRYIRNVHFLEPSEAGKTTFSLEGMDKYRFYELLNTGI